MAKVLKLSEEEMNMKGAPEGELHLAAVMERFEVPEPNGDPATILARLRDQLATRQGLHEWHEQFGAADIARGIILYESRLIDKAAAKELTRELCEMGGSARSVLAHQGLAALGDLLHCCPARVASDKEATKEAANILMENSKKSKARVLRARAASVLEEVCDSTEDPDDADALLVAMLGPALDKKWSSHLDLTVCCQAMTFALHATERMATRGLLEGKALTNLLSGLAIGCSSKSADAKIAAKKALGLLKDHGFDLKALTAQAPHLSPTASSEILRAAPGATSGGASMKGSKRNNAAGRTAAREAAAMEAAEAREREAAERAAAAPDEELYVPNIIPGKAKFGGDKKSPKSDEAENPFGSKRGSNIDRPIGGHQRKDFGTEKPVGVSSGTDSEENPFGSKRGSNIGRPIGGHKPSRDLGTVKLIGISSGSNGEENPFGSKRGSGVDRPIGGHKPSKDLGTEKPIGISSGSNEENPFGSKRGSGVDRPIGGHKASRYLGTEKPVGNGEENPFGSKRGSNIDRPISTSWKSAEAQDSRSLDTESPPLPLDDDVDAIPFGKHKRLGAKQPLQPPPPPTRKPIVGRLLPRPSSSGSIGSNSSGNSPTSTSSSVATRAARPSVPGKPVVAKPAKLLMKRDSATKMKAAAEDGNARLVDLTGGTTRKGVVLGFDSSAAALAHTLREELTGLGVEVRPLMKGASRPYLVEHEAELNKAALLVLLKTITYGQEPKHQVELDALTGSFTGRKDQALATLVVDLTTASSPTSKAAQRDELPLLDRYLKDRRCTLDPNQVYNAPADWAPTSLDLPSDLVSHVVNFMVGAANRRSKHAQDMAKASSSSSSLAAEELAERVATQASFLNGDDDDDDDEDLRPDSDEGEDYVN